MFWRVVTSLGWVLVDAPDFKAAQVKAVKLANDWRAKLLAPPALWVA